MYDFTINQNKEITLQIPDRKSAYFLNLLKENLKNDGVNIASDSELWAYYAQNQQKVADILSEISYSFTTLFSENYHDKTRLNFQIYKNEDGTLWVSESTTANYTHSNSKSKMIKSVDFDILVASNFGLSAFFFDGNGKLKKIFRSNKPYYSAIATEKYLILGGSHEPLQVIERKDYTVRHDIKGYCVSAIFKDDKKVFVVAAKTEIINKNPSDFSHYAVYEFNPEDGVLSPITAPLFGDVRGGCVYGDKLVLAEGDQYRIIVWGIKNHEISNIINGFNYPNDVTLTPRDTFLVANEHNNEVLEVDFRENKILRSTPMGELRSPGSALEIDHGNFKGYWLISDTGNDRVILVEPNQWEIVFEISELNAPFSAVPVF
ncbi:NHL repeat-containing protein [Candidatus Bealeia paramacronuclearis]|uniref:NHL repeat-containing protein n=1 Tax=Candidatus Bealeia paramacronuclearis TaxID=1921001 RepID=A0ABZ2C520_9PROT|nr:NHL repeat-containing protein [Candidatus Bealeia paramacronuclearis]